MISFFYYSLVWKLVVSVVSRRNWIRKLRIFLNMLLFAYHLLLTFKILYLQCFRRVLVGKYQPSRYEAKKETKIVYSLYNRLLSQTLQSLKF